MGHRAEVLGQASKATSKYKYWYNLLLIEPTNVAGKTKSVNIITVRKPLDTVLLESL